MRRRPRPLAISSGRVRTALAIQRCRREAEPRYTESVTVTRRWAAACGAVLALAGGAGCGKKGAPLAPYVLLPAAPLRVAAQRTGNDVYVTLTLPTQNVT